ncbi:MAG: isoprenylcysteine carboxylmethyltransferase family protein [Pseudomonadota bacterium]|nr:isoprenylcysteine carboxylmethyltransferase family protein [Pseudomonadota bacterium]
MTNLEHKIPPPLVAVMCGLVIWWLAGTTPGVVDPYGVAQPLAVLVAIMGLVFDSGGVLAFVKQKTTVNPIQINQASSLVTTGLYRYSRNPMYLGMALLLTSLTIWVQAPAGLAGVGLFVAFITRFQILPEERVLESLFGKDYIAYKGRVRRWF